MRPLLLLALVAVFYGAYLASAQSPWGPPPDCSTWKCNSTIGSTEEECSKRYGGPGRYHFYPNGTTCHCPFCMQVLQQGDDCSELMIADKAVYYECAQNLTCNWETRKCAPKATAA